MNDAQLPAAVPFAHQYLAELGRVLAALPIADLGRAMDEIERIRTSGRQLFIAGNGGSAATATHMGNDLIWGLAQVGGRPLRAVALADNLALTTAVANDAGYAEIFSVPLRALAQPGDALLVITGSGNSPNILRALDVAREMGLVTIGFLGRGGGKALSMLDIAVVVPSANYGPIEDVHMVFDHLLISWLRARAASG